jgi:ABC-type multidrug transport system fused ATPase/permease subunit
MDNTSNTKEQSKIQSFYNTLINSKFMLGYVWKAKTGKVFLLTKMLISALDAIVALSYAIMPGLIINELIGFRRLDMLLLYTGLLICTPVINQIINLFARKYTNKLSMALNVKFESEFYDHIIRMDYETLEKPDIQIMKERAQQTMGSILGFVDQLTGLLSAVLGLITISSIIITLNSLTILLIICVVFVNSIFTKRINIKQYDISKVVSKLDRQQWGVTYMLEQLHFAKELRVFGLETFLIVPFIKNKQEMNKLYLKSSTNQDILRLFNATTNFLQQLVIYAYLLYYVLFKNLAVGSMTIYLTATSQFFNALNQIFNSYLRISSSNLNIEEMKEFMEIPSHQHEMGCEQPVFNSSSILEFKNVSFKYPGSDRYVLENINVTLRGNEKLCIVGANGSGKSTFIKLLMRLYSATDGEILLNGKNINEYEYTQYQRLFAPVFQDFARYYFSLGENIVLSNDYNLEWLREVCDKIGLIELVEKLPKGFETQVDKWIDEEGFNPSGGEDQRIAIARAVYHNAPFLILDEPTAALDPLAEYEIYTQFNKMITDKAAVLITHRLSAVQMADNVAVLDNGKLVEYGTHKSLYDKGGIYTEMFNKQAEFYRDVK